MEKNKKEKIMATNIRQENGVTIVEPSGRIVGPAASELREVLTAQIEVSDTPRILINFENVNMIDSSGLGSLMEGRAMSTRKEGRIGVINVGNQIRNLLAVSRIVNAFEHFDNEDDAISGLAS